MTMANNYYCATNQKSQPYIISNTLDLQPSISWEKKKKKVIPSPCDGLDVYGIPVAL